MPSIDAHAPGTVCWYGLNAPDPEKARTFYGKLFGWDYLLGGPEMGHYAMAKLQERLVAGLGGMGPDSPSQPAWDVYFEVADAAQAGEKVAAAGGKLLSGPHEVPGGAGKMALCEDSTGARFGLWQSGSHRGSGLQGEHGAMCWQEINTRDAARARGFYASVFGIETRPLDGMDNYFTLHANALAGSGSRAPFGGLMQMGDESPESMPAHWMPYFAVDDADAAAAQARENGGKVCVPPFDTPYGKISVLEDPFGAVFSVLKLKG